MFDVFYFGEKPGLFPHERRINDINDAYSMSRTRMFWVVTADTDYTGFDFAWEPAPWEAHQRHTWRTQWQKTSGTYLYPNAQWKDTNYRSDQQIYKIASTVNWETPPGVDTTDFDFTWHPDDSDPPYIYQFGTQWQRTGGPRYVVPGATQVKYVSQVKARKVSVDSYWEIPENTIKESFDFTWHPDDSDPPYIYQFGTQWQRTGGPRYVVPGATQVKYVSVQVANMRPTVDNWVVPTTIDSTSFDFSWTRDDSDPPYIYQFGTQWQRTGGPRYVVPGATQVKYVSQVKARKVSVDSHWEIPPEVDTTDFDFTWHPDDSDPPYIYQFGTQWQRTGGPRYVVPGATQVKYVSQVKATVQTKHAPVVFIDHYNVDSAVAKELVSKKTNLLKAVRFVDNYLDTFKRLVNSLDDAVEHIWICSSICDYTDFDFSWHPSTWQGYMLHVFPSNEQKFGDTFYMHVPTFRLRCNDIELLDWYDLNFVESEPVPRFPPQVVQHSEDTHSQIVANTATREPLVVFSNATEVPATVPTVPLWRAKTRAITLVSRAGSTVVVPRDAIGNIKTQLWDYPYVDTSQATVLEQPLDVVFISNGEPTAETHWQHLRTALQAHCNRVVRVDGVNGRVAAYKAAAAAANTPWFFAVFAKLKVSSEFDWAWTPDYLQAPKHYIFYAKNPVNGLVYGHQAMIAYNKTLCLENSGTGLDFTLDQAHEVIPELSGVAVYNSDPWTAWRTAFREVIKLRVDSETNVDYALKHRLERWQSAGVGEFAEWSQKGAVDAIQYYNSVNGEFAKLKLSYEWEWLSKFYKAQYPA